ncbi:MAG: potassium transporter TrkG, partial [Alphaproteobacteria bacterium]
MLLPALADFGRDNSDWHAFVESAAFCGFVGVMIIAATRMPGGVSFDMRQAFLITVGGWLSVSLLGALPFLGLGIGITDAVFESMSGLTTTGATILYGLDMLPPGILLWRAQLQWIGGIGIVATAIVMLPFLRVGGMQLFRIEHTMPGEEKLSSGFWTIAWLFAIYAGITLACIIAYRVLGMSLFDAVTHAMATVSTGGFSTHDASFGYFASPALHWVATVFMLAGALPFYLYLRVLRGRPLTL